MIVAGMVISANCAVVLEKAGVVNVVVAIHLPRRQNHSSKGRGRMEGGGGVRNQEQCRATTRTNNNNEGINLRSHPANRGPTLGEQHGSTCPQGERRKYDNSLGSRFWDRTQDAVLTSSYLISISQNLDLGSQSGRDRNIIIFVIV